MKTYLVALCVLLASCATLTLDKVSALRKNMTRQEARATLGIEPKAAIDLGDSVTVDVYDLSNGGYNAPYYVSYKEGKVLYWGYPHEYAREKDPLLNRVAKETTERLNVAKAQGARGANK